MHSPMHSLRIALLSSPSLRSGPMSPLLRFVRDFAPLLKATRIVTTEGCYHSILRAGLLHNHPDFQSVGTGLNGAIVRIAREVVAEIDPVEVVVYLVDSRDPTSVYPESNALQRECVVNSRPFLSTERSARAWAALTSDVFDIPQAWHYDDSHDNSTLTKETVALIAHDAMKEPMLQFVLRHFDLLSKFGHRVGTGTTASLLSGLRPARLSDSEWTKLASHVTALRERLHALPQFAERDACPFVTPFKSGPQGGDVQIAGLVLEDKCSTIVFFEDPQVARQHETDIQLLQRTGRVKGHNVICLHDQLTADYFCNCWSKRIAAGKSPEPRHIVDEFECRYGVKAVIVQASSGDTWPDLRRNASWYVMSQIAAVANARRRQSDVARVAVSWGFGMSSIVDGFDELWDVLKARDARETAGRHPTMLASPNSADTRYFRPNNVIVAPFQGITAAAEEEVEGNAIAGRVAAFFRGESLILALSSLLQRRPSANKKPRELPRPISDHWESCDLVLGTCAPVKKHLSGQVRARAFEDHIAQMTEATVGEFCGIYLTKSGAEFDSEHFQRIGMPSASVRRVVERGGQVVLVVGAQPERLAVTSATLRSGMVNVIVTDAVFARQLLAMG